MKEIFAIMIGMSILAWGLWVFLGDDRKMSEQECFDKEGTIVQKGTCVGEVIGNVSGIKCPCECCKEIRIDKD